MKKNKDISTLDPRQFIIIKGARMHNLKNVDVAIPRNKMIVITGLSGSGKSSLAFDTLYAEGQRRYVESLSAYARQFLGKLEKPQVDYIKGISPAIAIEQKVISRNPRSTVGTITEVYDYLKLLFARIGKTYSPISGELVKRHTISDVTDFVNGLTVGSKLLLLAPLEDMKDRSLAKQLDLLSQQGFTRAVIDESIVKIADLNDKSIKKNSKVYLLIDRLVTQPGEEDFLNRVADSVQTTFNEGRGTCEVWDETTEKRKIYLFSNLFERDGILFEEPDLNFFAFNNPIGACKHCEGFGSVIGIDHDLVIPNKSLSVYNNAIVPWSGPAMSYYRDKLIKKAHLFDFPVHKPIAELSNAEYNLLWTGNKHFEGLNAFFEMLSKELYKIQYRVMLARYRGKTSCPDCLGTRLRKDAGYVKINQRNISELVLMPVSELQLFFKSLKLNEHEEKIAKRLLIEINNRLQYLNDVGLGYLTLNRVANTLSGGESQRINLATQLGSTLVGSLYILDEPSIGLHPRDTRRLIGVLRSLQKQGNTVIIVEHDEDIMREADELIDIGPEAGTHGGNLVFQGTHKELLQAKDSLTAGYLTHQLNIPTPIHRRNWKNYVEVAGITENNLKNLSVKFPLNVLCAVTGVSGSGKSTLIRKGLMPALQKYLDGYFNGMDISHLLRGQLNQISELVYVDQNPIGKSSRSNPVTYVKAFDEIRGLFSDQPLAKTRGYKPGFFSFNVEGGRCETCQGDGEITVEMQFMADIQLTCESCGGKRYKQEALDVTYREKSIADVLALTVDDAIVFFKEDQKNRTAVRITEKLQPLQDVGLGYVPLGQSNSTLSGGEAQRIKLATFLSAGSSAAPILFVFDEPTTGLHYHDVAKLLNSFSALIRNGHSIIVVEHNLEVIRCADWIIDMGPEGGDGGGQLVFEGTPEALAKSGKGYTGHYLKDQLAIKR